MSEGITIMSVAVVVGVLCFFFVNLCADVHAIRKIMEERL